MVIFARVERLSGGFVAKLSDQTILYQNDAGKMADLQIACGVAVENITFMDSVKPKHKAEILGRIKNKGSELEMLADSAKQSADRSIEAIDDALDFVEKSNERLEKLEQSKSQKITLYFIIACSTCHPPIRVGAYESREEAQGVFDACEEMVKTIPKYMSMDQVFELCKSWPMGSRTYLLYDFREAKIEEVEFEDTNAANLERLILTAVEWTENQIYRYDFYTKFRESLRLMNDERRRRED